MNRYTKLLYGTWWQKYILHFGPAPQFPRKANCADAGIKGLVDGVKFVVVLFLILYFS